MPILTCLQKNIVKRTVCNANLESGTSNRTLCTQKHKASCAHPQWARNPRTWTVDDWRRVILSDEPRFCLHLNNARCRMRTGPTEAFHLELVEVQVQVRCSFMQQISTNMNQHVSFMNLDDEVLLFIQHILMSILLWSFFKMTTVNCTGMDLHVTTLMYSECIPEFGLMY